MQAVVLITASEVAVPAVNVVVTAGVPLPEALLDELRGLDTRLSLQRISREQRPYLAAGRGDGSEPEARELAAMLAEAEVVIAAFEAPADLMQRTPKLRWFHTFSAGIDQYVRWGFLKRDIQFTNGSGPTAIPIAEYIVMAMLMLAKHAAAYVRLQDERRWERLVERPGGGSELRGKTVGIVGLGQIGSEAARLAKAFGCRVIGSRRSATEAREDADGVDLLLPAGDLARLLAESDFVVLTAPATPETQALMNAETLAQMKSGASLINIARGSLVDEAALAAAIKSGRIAGAALDVFQHEPLAPESELWQLPQVIVTPHISNASEFFLRRQIDLAKENLRRYLHGEPLLNLVTPERGY